ncbi:tRNA1(Val) (adenine(37)-N6)-methyltransferase [Motilimonas eburnea]|uniref:tRNA1(Val) (adenine(37)-N6)-methyltransferase n=1 Tax=Motilimonas eburnea TaxID=1737488 RepID=UPI001E58C36B|nr:methyltransferase [Motilimonas eburnea]MCE2570897.1 methyltransferase [Motilimonas eburnea]
MASKAGFTFKRFHINHDLCAMKVGTDGILLGAWADVGSAEQVLDMGTGSGLIALQLAQRSHGACHITAVEIDSNAALQAKQNVAASPWPNKVKVVEQSIQQFAATACQQYDLIVSNPPYFPAGQALASQARATARHTGSLGKMDLLTAIMQLLSANGRCDLVLPFDVALEYIDAAKKIGLFLVKRVDVHTLSNKPPHRMLLSLAKTAQGCDSSTLTIHHQAGEYSSDYVALTRDFYLKMT